jgi:hypothetical protein
MHFIPKHQRLRNGSGTMEQALWSPSERLRRRSTEGVGRLVRWAVPWRIDVPRIAANVPGYDPELTATVYGEWDLKRWALACLALCDLAVSGDIAITRDRQAGFWLVRRGYRGLWPEGGYSLSNARPSRVQR